VGFDIKEGVNYIDFTSSSVFLSGRLSLLTGVSNGMIFIALVVRNELDIHLQIKYDNIQVRTHTALR
jgi:hypothetical protein